MSHQTTRTQGRTLFFRCFLGIVFLGFGRFGSRSSRGGVGLLWCGRSISFLGFVFLGFGGRGFGVFLVATFRSLHNAPYEQNMTTQKTVRVSSSSCWPVS